MALILNNGTEQHQLTEEEARKGGIRSGEVRKEKATMRKTLEMLLNETIKKGKYEGKTYRELTTLGLIKGAIDGKADNYKTIVQLLGEMQESSNETPSININVVDNSKLEKALYDEDGK